MYTLFMRERFFCERESRAYRNRLLSSIDHLSRTRVAKSIDLIKLPFTIETLNWDLTESYQSNYFHFRDHVYADSIRARARNRDGNAKKLLQKQHACLVMNMIFIY
jgi:hypothetical protein